MIEIGTRQKQGFTKSHPPSRGETRSHKNDLGMTKRFTGTAGSTTFNAGAGQIQDAGLPANFVVGDWVLVHGDGGVNGVLAVTGIGSGFLTTDPPPKAGGGGSTVITLRTP